MRYIFIVNGRNDYRDRITREVESQISSLKLKDSTIYSTRGQGDATRYVRVHCDLHPKDEECFVACGGSGTTNEVLSGIMGFEHKRMAILTFGATNDFTKCFPERDFNSVAGILNGEIFRSDVIKANDYYSLNVINVGFDAHVAMMANSYIQEGLEGSKAYSRAVLVSLLTERVNRASIEVDGKRFGGRTFLLCNFANGRYCGGQFLCAPDAKLDDGLMDICRFRPMSLLSFLVCIHYYRKGEHLTNPFCRRRLKWCRAAKARVSLRNSLVFLSLDGESAASRDFCIEVLPKAVEIVLPL